MSLICLLSCVIQRLCEWHLDNNEKLKAEVKKLGPAALRQTYPVGTDMQGNRLWLLEVCAEYVCCMYRQRVRLCTDMSNGIVEVHCCVKRFSFMSNELWLRYSTRGNAGSSRRLPSTSVHEVGTASMKLRTQSAEGQASKGTRCTWLLRSTPTCADAGLTLCNLPLWRYEVSTSVLCLCAWVEVSLYSELYCVVVGGGGSLWSYMCGSSCGVHICTVYGSDSRTSALSSM